MSSDIERYWEKVVPLTEGLRISVSPTWGEHSEYFYNEVMKIRRKQHPELYN
jgi:hypothetical protein